MGSDAETMTRGVVAWVYRRRRQLFTKYLAPKVRMKRMPSMVQRSSARGRPVGAGVARRGG